MKKEGIFALMVIAIFLVIACMFVGLPARENIAIFSGHPNWMPYMGTDKSGEYNVGIGPNTTMLAFETIDVKVISKNLGSWENAQELAKKGEIDGLVAAYKTKEREDFYVFSVPYAYDNVTIFSLKENAFVFVKKEDLLSKNGIATIGDSYGQEMDDYIIQANVPMVRASSPEQAFTMLAEKKGDYVIYSSDSGRKLIKEMNLSGVVESEPVARQSFHVAISKKSKYAKDIGAINTAIENMIAKGTIPKQ